jgi:hypothetical protein
MEDSDDNEIPSSNSSSQSIPFLPISSSTVTDSSPGSVLISYLLSKQKQNVETPPQVQQQIPIKEEPFDWKKYQDENKEEHEESDTELIKMIDPTYQMLAQTITLRKSQKIIHLQSMIYNQDKAQLIVADTLFLPGEKGLFHSAESKSTIRKGDPLTFYTGVLRTKLRSAYRNTIDARYLMDVISKGGHRISYVIDGASPDPKFGGSSRCIATYINHHQKRDNVEFHTVQMKGKSGRFSTRVLVIASQDIQPGEELFANYGDSYHKSLQELNILKE